MKDKRFFFLNRYFIVKINNMNHQIEIKATPFSSKIIILIDNNICAEKKLNSAKSRIIYPTKIDSTDVVIELIDCGLYYKKDIYIDSISIYTGYHIDKEKNDLQNKVNMSISKYLLQNIATIFKMSCILSIGFIIINSIALYIDIYRERLTINLNRFLLGSVLLIIYSIVTPFGYFTYDWLNAKYKLKKWDSQYQIL